MLDREQGPKELKYRYDCKVDEMFSDIACLSDLVRDEFKRVDSRFGIVDNLIAKITEETKDKLFNM